MPFAQTPNSFSLVSFFMRLRISSAFTKYYINFHEWYFMSAATINRMQRTTGSSHCCRLNRHLLNCSSDGAQSRSHTHNEVHRCCGGTPMSLVIIIIIIIIMLGCITCCALHACLRFAQSSLALHASPLRPADLLRLCSARFFFDAGF